ncbi:MAG: glycosyl transferase family 36 [Candidatus Eisenbacteria bacterium]|uniref:Glycosyl transferase family 36 n=1 Tax=Eiseniibacteriota bacterium TaxID=2212470 RepID=A0A538U3I2_UNCEI|nr:MAG: glycosyl transferase family 36 [Candidatus Eisenbacteria bacterium]
MPKLFATKYGHFSADGREYVITRPDTPKPWVNVVCPGEYGTVISQAGSGYSWMTHATLNRLTRWEQDLVRDEWGKHLYCRDRASGKLWSLAFQPVRSRPTRYECRHGVGYTTITALHQGVSSEYTIFVPPDEPLEIWRIRLTNRGRATRRLDLFSYLEWNLGPASDTHREFHKLFIEQEHVASAHGLLATKRLNTIAEHGRGQPWNVEWPHVAFHAASVAPVGLETDKERFLGRHGTLAAPAALAKPRLSGTAGKWQDAIASLQVGVTLRPGETREIAFTLGVAETRAHALRLARKYRTPAAVESAWRAMRRHWEALLSPLEVHTPDPGFDVMTNVWLKYQAMSGRIWGRSGYYQPGGAFGYRDQLQDSQVFLPLDPERTRRQILLHAAHQYGDGTTLHWWHPLTEEGVKKPLNDDLLWLPFVTLNYLRETADFGLLEERAPFLSEPGGGAESGTLYDHCRRAIDSFWTRLSPRGVPRMGAGDWNDGLSAIGRELKSESVWLAHFLIGILEGWTELERRRARPDQDVIARYGREARKMRAAVNEHFWDGAWYVRATTDSGEAIGSHRNQDGKIFINAQTWAVLHDVAPPERVPALMRSMERLLYKDYGPLALYPAYRAPDAEIGYLTRYAPGARENGGLYTHAAVWAVQAECVLKRRRKAWALFKRFWPVHRGMDPDLYQAEPYVSPGNVDGPHSPYYGRGGWTWYTGSAAWMLRIGAEWLLGVRPTWDGLLIDPCLPPEWNGFRMIRRFRGSTYRIEVKVHPGAPQYTLDGVPHPGPLVPAFADGEEHVITARVPTA